MPNKLKKLLCITFSITVLIFSLCSCSVSKLQIGDPESENYPVTIIDENNTEVIIKKAVTKVAVLSESLAQICVDLGSSVEVKLAARSSDVTLNGLEVLDVIYSNDKLDIDTTIELGIDLILTQSPLSESDTLLAQENNIIVLQLPNANSRTTFKSIYNDVASSILGAKFGPDLANSRTHSILMSLDDIKREVPQSDIVSTICYIKSINENGQFEIVTNDSFSGMLLEWTGSVNIANSSADSLATAGTIIRNNPTFIFTDIGLKDQILKVEEFSTLSAVENNTIYEFDYSLLEYQSSYSIDVIIELCKLMYPEMLETTSSIPSTSSNSSTSSSFNIDEYYHPNSIDESSSESDIAIVQNRLKELGFITSFTTGKYDNSTKNAISHFQKEIKVEQTGVGDSLTISVLFASDAPNLLKNDNSSIPLS